MKTDVQKLYNIRFQSDEKRKKDSLWKEICSYLETFLPKSVKVIVDIGGGYCDFINNINCDCRKIVIDLNPDTKVYAKKGVEVLTDNFLNLPQHLESNTVSLFFMSNFLEHISKDDINSLFQIQYDLLKPGGEVWILTPNIKYVGGKYWDFFDHITPITEKSLIEAAVLHGFHLKKCISRFLPFTTKSRLPQSAMIVKMYLKLMPFSGYIFGEQSFLIFKKIGSNKNQ